MNSAIQAWAAAGRRWNWLAAGLGTGLFALRVSLEMTPPRPAWGIGAALLCVAGAALARKAAISWTPLQVAWLYVVWPAASPPMALATGLVALIAWIAYNVDERRCPAWAIDGALLAGALALYVSTLAPTLLPADSGEFQIVGPLLGVAHPPGYALFTLVAKLFSLLPLGQVPWRVNLMGAVTGALTLLVVARTARQISGSFWAGLGAAGALGVSTSFWSQSTTINIRAFTVLFTALSCYYLVRFVLSEGDTSALTGLAASFGLGVAHHYSLAALAPVFGAVLLWRDPGLIRRFRAWPRHLLAFLAPFASNAYIVARAATGAPFGTDNLTSAGRVIDHLLGKGFGGDMFAFLRFDRVLWERFLVVGNILHFQFGAPLLLLSAVGFAWLAWRKRKLALLLGGMFVTMAFLVATYRAPQSVEYLMPAYVPLALCVGSALGWTARSASRQADKPLYAASVALLLLPVFFLGQAHLSSYVELHGDHSAREYAESVLLQAPPGAHILANWHWYTPLLYLQLVEGKRPDVEVTYLYPQGATEMPQAWAERIASELESSDRPLIVTNYYSTYRDLPYRFLPLGEAFRVQAGPSWQVPAGIERLDVDFAAAFSSLGGTQPEQAQIRLLGYRIHQADAIHPGDSVTVDLVWQPLVRLERGYSFFVHLVGQDNVPLGQRDQRHDAAPAYEPGEVLVDRYDLAVFLNAAPGTYRLVAGVYFTEGDSWQRLVSTADGSDALTVAAVSIAPAPQPPVTTRSLYHPFAGGPALVGVDYDDTVPGQRRVYLHWQACERAVLARLYAGGNLAAQAVVPGSPGAGYVTTVLDLPAGASGLSVALSSLEDPAPLPHRGAWGKTGLGAVPLPQPRPRQYYLPLGGKVALVGVRAGETWAAGSRERVAFEFLSLRPIVLDYVVSAGVQGSRVTEGPDDGVPAIGAMPTFKWIRGSQVTDVHLIRVLDDASGEAELTLGVYDAFTTRDLPPLDERIARLQRAGVPLQRIVVP
jgi:hypothetical protein